MFALIVFNSIPLEETVWSNSIMSKGCVLSFFVTHVYDWTIMQGSSDVPKNLFIGACKAGNPLFH